MFFFLELRTLETTYLGCVPGKVLCASTGPVSPFHVALWFPSHKSSGSMGWKPSSYYFCFYFLSHAISIPNMELLTCSKFFTR